MPLAAWDGAVETAAKAAEASSLAQALTGRRDAQRSPLPICTGPRHLKRRNTVRPRALRELAVVERRKALRRSWPVLARLVSDGETERRLRLAALRTPRLSRGPFPRATAGTTCRAPPRRHNNRGDAPHPHNEQLGKIEEKWQASHHTPSSYAGLAVRRTASLRLPITRVSILPRKMDGRVKPGHDAARAAIASRSRTRVHRTQRPRTHANAATIFMTAHHGRTCLTTRSMTTLAQRHATRTTSAKTNRAKKKAPPCGRANLKRETLKAPHRPQWWR